MRQYQNNILITGTNGTLGNAFKQHYQKSHKVMGTSRSILNFKDISEISVASGVVVDSNANHEFNENFLKAKALIDLFK